jgi:hypothetical protein
MKFDTTNGFPFDDILRSGKKNRDGIFNFLPNAQDSKPLLKALSEWPGFFDALSAYHSDWHMRKYPFDWIYEVVRYDHAFGRQIVTKVIDWVISHKPESVEAIFFDLFRAVAAAEVRFVEKYIPQNSHEERLTGHLMSETVFSLDLIEPMVKDNLQGLYGEEINFDFHYADIATDRMEKYTGGDFAIIIEVDLPDVPSFVRAFKFQAKKATPSARIDLKQIEVLSKENPEGSFYVFYNLSPKSMNSGRRSPLVVGALECQKQLDSKEEQKTATINADWIHKAGIPFSAFITLAAMQPDRGLGFQCNSLREAARYIYHVPYDLRKNDHDWNKPPSRLIVVSIGGSIPKNYASPNSEEQNFLFRTPPLRDFNE